MLDSRRYLDRIYSAPKDKGALHLFAVLCVKSMRKHGWPAHYSIHADNCFSLVFENTFGGLVSQNVPLDFRAATDDCVFNMAAIHKVDLEHWHMWADCSFRFVRPYTVKDGGFIAPCLVSSGNVCRCFADSDFICSRKKWVKI